MFFSFVSPMVGDREFEPRPNLPVGVLGQADSAGRTNAFQPRGDVDAVAHEVAVALLDDVADMDADAKHDAPVLGHAGVALDHGVLDFERTSHRVDGAAELDDGAVACALDDAALVHGDRRVDEVAAERAEPSKKTFLARAGQSRKADHVGD